jgi:hypothetical protein
MTRSISKLILATLVALAASSDTASGLSGAHGVLPNVMEHLHAGDRFRFRISVSSSDGSRSQVDDVVDVVASTSDRVEVLETFEQAFGATIDGGGWRALDRAWVRTKYDGQGNVVAVSGGYPATSAWFSDSRIHHLLPLFPVVDFGYSPMHGSRAGDTWTHDTNYHRYESFPTDWEHQRSAYTLDSTGACAAGRCVDISATDRVSSGTGTIFVRRELVADASDLILLNGGGVVTDGDHTSRFSVERISAPSKMPPSMGRGVGSLEVFARPWLEVWIDGVQPVDLMSTPLIIEVPVGRHIIQLQNDTRDVDEIVEVSIEEAKAFEIDRDYCLDQTSRPGCW